MIILKNDKISVGYIPTYKVASRSIVKSINDFSTNEEIINTNANKNNISEKDFVFTFVRNPVDRFLSSYYFTKEHHNKRLKNVDDFLAFLQHEKVQDLNVHRRIGFILNHCTPLTNFLLNDKGEIDKKLNIYKFENLNKDWTKVIRKINTLFKPEKKILKLEHINKTKGREKVTLNKKQLDIIYQIYEKDFVNFDYELYPIST